MNIKVALFALCLVASAVAHGTSYTKIVKPHQGKYEYDIEHSKHGSWHGSAHPDGYGGLGDGTGSYRLGGHTKAIGVLPQGGGYDSWGRYKRSAAHGGWSQTSVSKPHQGKFDYDIEHSKHGSWHGSAHPDGYGGLGDGTGSYRLGDHTKAIGVLPQGGGYDSWGRYKRSAAHGGWSQTSVSKPHQGKFDYDIEHSKHGSWHGSAHPDGYGGLGDGTGSYRLGDHTKAIGVLPQGGGYGSWGRYKRSAAHGGWSKTSVSKPHQGKFDYDIEHSKHGSWHGSAHPDGYGGLGDGTGSYRLGDHTKAIGVLPQGGGYDSWGRYKRSAAHGGWSKTSVSKPHQGKFDYDIEHSKHGSWHGSAHPDGYGGLGDGTGSYRLGDHTKAIGVLPQGGGYDSWGRYRRSAAHGGWSKTSVSKPHQGKFDYDIEHSKHGSWHGSSHPHGYGGL